MKILILGHYEIASNYAISLVVNQLYKQHDISIMLSGRGDTYEQSLTAIEKNSFAALAQYEQSLCDDLNAGVDSLNLHCDSFDTLVTKAKHPIEILNKPNSKSGLEKIRTLAPDFVISIRYRKILKENAISIPKYGVINLHSGLLPQYRGAMATFWAMLNGDENIGSTLHYISDGTIDTGRIIARSSKKCQYEKSYLENVLELYPTGSHEIVKAVNQIQELGFASAEKQITQGNYYSFPQSNDLSRFKSAGNKLF